MLVRDGFLLAFAGLVGVEPAQVFTVEEIAHLISHRAFSLSALHFQEGQTRVWVSIFFFYEPRLKGSRSNKAIRKHD